MDGRFFLLRTSDGGRTWRSLPLESRPAALEGEAAFAASGTALHVRGNAAWFCTGGAASRIWLSSDGGVRWEAVSAPLGGGTPSSGGFSVYFLNEKAGIAVGGDYRNEPADADNAAVTFDGGKTWAPVSGRRPGGFREAVAAVPEDPSSPAVTVGPSGSDVSFDGGQTWIAIGGPEGFHTLGFAGNGLAAWAAGRNGLIARLVFQ